MGFNNTEWAREALGIVGNKPRGAKAGRAPAARKARKPRARKALKITAGALRYVKKKDPAGLPRFTTSEKVVGALAAGSKGSRVAAARLLRGVGGLVEAGAAGSKLAQAGVLGGIAIAGILAYFITSYVLERPDRARATLQENAARAADAYRAARVKIESDQGRPLTATQKKQLGTFFKAKLNELGLDSQELSRLTGKGYVPKTIDRGN